MKKKERKKENIIRINIIFLLNSNNLETSTHVHLSSLDQFLWLLHELMSILLCYSIALKPHQ